MLHYDKLPSIERFSRTIAILCGGFSCCTSDLQCYTQDGKRSAQFEQTLLVTDTGVEILTARRENGGLPHFLSPS